MSLAERQIITRCLILLCGMLLLLLCALPCAALAEEPIAPEFEPVRAAQAQWEQEKGEHRFWSYEDKAAFCEQYNAAPGGTAFLSPDATVRCRLPSPSDTPYDAALLAAKQAIVTYLGEDSNLLDTLLVDAHFRQSWWVHPDKSQSNAWVFLLCETTGERHPLYQVVVLSPGAEAVSVMAHDVPKEMSGDIRLRIWCSENSYEDYGLPVTVYHNPDGGVHYHYDANCPSVSSRFLPLTPFASELLFMRPQYSVLTACDTCVK